MKEISVPLVDIEACLGHVKIDTWFENRKGVLVGMMRRTNYDRYGHVVSDVIEESGVKLIYRQPQKPRPSLWQRFMSYAMGEN